ncbi:bifunctional DNA primase/polymerase [Arthrobacter sp. SA17]
MIPESHVSEISLLEIAHTFTAAGISVVPVASDGTKRPALKKWTEYQHSRASGHTLRDWFTTGNVGIGVVTGTISGGLEMTEIEGRGKGRLADLANVANNSGLGPLWTKLTLGWFEKSPSGGYHWFYRVDWPEGQKPAGNTKLASRPSTATELSINPRQKQQVIAETRGEGGFVVTAPSSGNVHPTGKPWERVTGGPTTIPVLTLDEREDFHSLLGWLNEPLADQLMQEELTPSPRTEGQGLSPATTSRPKPIGGTSSKAGRSSTQRGAPATGEDPGRTSALAPPPGTPTTATGSTSSPHPPSSSRKPPTPSSAPTRFFTMEVITQRPPQRCGLKVMGKNRTQVFLCTNSNRSCR